MSGTDLGNVGYQGGKEAAEKIGMLMLEVGSYAAAVPCLVLAYGMLLRYSRRVFCRSTEPGHHATVLTQAMMLQFSPRVYCDGSDRDCAATVLT
eukprot:1140171-Rhodomonas_salina.2